MIGCGVGGKRGGVGRLWFVVKKQEALRRKGKKKTKLKLLQLLKLLLVSLYL